MARKRSGAGGRKAREPAQSAQGPHGPQGALGDGPALPRGRHGLSPVGRVKAADLAARKTAFADELLGRARPIVPAAGPSEFTRDVRERLLVPVPPQVGGRGGALAGAIMERYEAAEPLGARGAGGVTGAADFQTLAARLGLLDRNARARRGLAVDQELETGDERADRALGSGAFDGSDDLAGPTRPYAPAENDANGADHVDRASGGMPVPREQLQTVVASHGTLLPGADPGRPLVLAQPLAGQASQELSERLHERGDWRPTFLADRQLPVAVSLPPGGAATEVDEEQEDEEPGDATALPAAARIDEAAAMAPFTALRELSGLVGSIQRKAEPGVDLPAGQQRTLALGQAMQSVGEPLEPTTRRTMETALGADFAGVRVHTDGPAAGAAAGLGAHAFTLGGSIYFAENAYQPAAPAGLALLGHELTHTAQQQGAPQRRAVAVPDGVDLYDDEPPHLEEQARSVEAMLHTLFSNAPPDERADSGSPLGLAPPAVLPRIMSPSNTPSDTPHPMTLAAEPLALWDRAAPSGALESPHNLAGTTRTPADRASAANTTMDPAAGVDGRPDQGYGQGGRAGVATPGDMRAMSDPTGMLMSGVGEPGGVTGRAPRDLDGDQDRPEDDAGPSLSARGVSRPGVGALAGRAGGRGAGEDPGVSPPVSGLAGAPEASGAPVPTTLFDSAGPAPTTPLDRGSETERADTEGGAAIYAWAEPLSSDAPMSGDPTADGMGLPDDDLAASSLGSGVDVVASMPPPRAVLPPDTVDTWEGLTGGTAAEDERAGAARGTVSPARGRGLPAGEDGGVAAADISGPGPSGIAPADLLTSGIAPTPDVPTLSPRGVDVPMRERSLAARGGELTPPTDGGGAAAVPSTLTPASITPSVMSGFSSDTGSIAMAGGDAVALADGIAASYTGSGRSRQARDDGDTDALGTEQAPAGGNTSRGRSTTTATTSGDNLDAGAMPGRGLATGGVGAFASGLPPAMLASGLATGSLADLTPVANPSAVASGYPSASSLEVGDRPAADEDDGGDEEASAGEPVESGAGAARGLPVRDSAARSGGLSIIAMAPEALLTAGIGAFDDLIARGADGRDGAPPAGQSARDTLSAGHSLTNGSAAADAWDPDGFSNGGVAAVGDARGGTLAGARLPSGSAGITGPMGVMGLPGVGLAPTTAHDGPAPASMLTSGIAFPIDRQDEPDGVDGGPSVGPDTDTMAPSGGARAYNGANADTRDARPRGPSASLVQSTSLAALLSSRAGTGDGSSGHDDGVPDQEGPAPHNGASMTQRVTPAFGGMAPVQENHAEMSPVPSPDGVPDNIEETLARLDVALGPGTGAEPARGGDAPSASDEGGATAAPAREAPPAPEQMAPSVDDLVNQVLARLKRQLMLDHDRAGGFLSHLMR